MPRLHGSWTRSSAEALLRAPLLALLIGCGGESARPITSSSLVGDGVCVGCHEKQGRFLETAHAQTSAQASAATIDGSFAEGENILLTSHPLLHYRMEATEDGFYQIAVEMAGPDTTLTAAPFDIVVGSGRKGQSYLFWRGDRLFQLPISFWTGVGWANSPGYADGVVNFDRPVNPRCLECHATYAESLPAMAGANRYDTTSLVLGISCESCHGAGSEHVAAAREGRAGGWLSQTAIANPATFSRERQVDGCALCHGGIGESVRPPFSYRPGEPLSEYLHQPVPAPDAAVDVHGNQVALLERSPCFIQSEMTCSTCHDVHRPQRDITEFSAVCTSCHTPGEAIAAQHGEALPGNCIDCHMPNLETNVIVADNAGGVLRPRVRSHWIKIYPEISAELRKGL